MLYFLFYTYLIVIIYLIFYHSKNGTLYIFSPLIIIYTNFAVNDIIPLLILENAEPITNNVYTVTAITSIINLLFLFLFRRQLKKKIGIKIEPITEKLSAQRKVLIIILLSIEIAYGFLTGVTPVLLSGGDVSYLRKTNEIGLGFINSIPQTGWPILILVLLLVEKRKKLIYKGIVCFFSGIIFYISTAARGGILTFFNIFIIWFNIQKRGLKWYEYLSIYYIIGPIVATITQLIRNAKEINQVWIEFFAHQLNIYHWNTIPLMRHFETAKHLMGESYYTALVRIIPRFIWPNKPLSIDYKYKEILGYDVPGGIYTSTPCEMYINFGLYFIIPYCAYLFLIHKMYSKLISPRSSFFLKICLLYLLTLKFIPNNLIEGLEILLLFTFLCIIFYRRKNVF